MNDLNSLQIKQLLNRSITRLDRPTQERLRDARAQALAASHEARHTSPAFVWASKTPWGGKTLGGIFNDPQKISFWAAAILLVILVSGTTIYLQQAMEHDNTDLDIAILTDELPIHIYLD